MLYDLGIHMVSLCSALGELYPKMSDFTYYEGMLKQNLSFLQPLYFYKVDWVLKISLDPRGGHLPNFCTRVCQRGLRNSTLSVAIFWKKTPFLLQFFGKKHAVFLANFAEMYPFLKKNCWKLARSAENCKNCHRVIHSLHKNTPFLLRFCLKLYPFSCILMIKNTPFLLRFWWKRYPRCWHTRGTLYIGSNPPGPTP